MSICDGSAQGAGAAAGVSTNLPYHSLLAELGKLTRRYREMVAVFNGARVYPKHL